MTPAFYVLRFLAYQTFQRFHVSVNLPLMLNMSIAM